MFAVALHHRPETEQAKERKRINFAFSFLPSFYEATVRQAPTFLAVFRHTTAGAGSSHQIVDAFVDCDLYQGVASTIV
jgi:hypothetical protein